MADREISNDDHLKAQMKTKMEVLETIDAYAQRARERLDAEATEIGSYAQTVNLLAEAWALLHRPDRSGGSK